MSEKDSNEKQFSRRDFLKTTGMATGGIIGGSLLGGVVGYNMNPLNPGADQGATSGQQGEQTASQENPGRLFFHNDADFETISQAMERIFPEDDMGPGAIALGAPYFLDMQLAGAYGNNSKEYMQGPFYEGEPTQGYQSRLTRAELFTLGIERLNAVANNEHESNFAELEAEQMDEVLDSFQKGDADMGVPAATATPDLFFDLLRSATLEGVYSDPMYRGNRNMDGWRMKQFPGHQHAYTEHMESDSFVEVEPQSLYGGGN